MMDTLENKQKKTIGMLGALSIAIGLLLEPSIGQRSLIIFGAGLATLFVVDWWTQRRLEE